MTQNSDSTDDFGRKYNSSQFLDVVQQSGPVTTGEVANKIDCHRNTARKQLMRLAERDEISKEEIGQGFVWRTN